MDIPSPTTSNTDPKPDLNNAGSAHSQSDGEAHRNLPQKTTDPGCLNPKKRVVDPGHSQSDKDALPQATDSGYSQVDSNDPVDFHTVRNILKIKHFDS